MRGLNAAAGPGKPTPWSSRRTGSVLISMPVEVWKSSAERWWLSHTMRLSTQWPVRSETFHDLLILNWASAGPKHFTETAFQWHYLQLSVEYLAGMKSHNLTFTNVCKQAWPGANGSHWNTWIQELSGVSQYFCSYSVHYWCFKKTKENQKRLCKESKSQPESPSSSSSWASSSSELSSADVSSEHTHAQYRVIHVSLRKTLTLFIWCVVSCVQQKNKWTLTNSCSSDAQQNTNHICVIDMRVCRWQNTRLL